MVRRRRDRASSANGYGHEREVEQHEDGQPGRGRQRPGATCAVRDRDGGRQQEPQPGRVRDQEHESAAPPAAVDGSQAANRAPIASS